MHITAYATLAMIEILKKVLAVHISMFTCSVSPRMDCDWFTACDVLTKMPELLEGPVFETLAFGTFERRSVNCGFEIDVDAARFRSLCSSYIGRNSLSIRRLLPSPPYPKLDI